jgi:bifunctional NMN adenylyltransferase/nudix hydrolase
VRKFLFEGAHARVRDLVPAGTWSFIEEWLKTPEYARLNEEYWAIEADKAAWVNSPYQPTFVTTDAVVLCSGHVLVVRRKGKYGHGLIALPGGYIKADETLLDSCVRELKEETSIRMQAADVKACLTGCDVFDDPGRDLRGRTITHGFRFVLPTGQLPKVKGKDDADKAWWMSYSDALASEPRFFSDHYHIINRFISRS